MSTVKIGDYVLATKYDDGDPGDHWACGFVASIMDQYDPPRYDVVDNNQVSFRGNGFRKVERITLWMGKQLIAIGDKMVWAGKSVWDIRDGLLKDDPDPLSIGRMVGTDVYWLESKRWNDTTTALLMRCTNGLKQKKLLADDMLKDIIITKEQIVDIELQGFIDTCAKLETKS